MLVGLFGVWVFCGVRFLLCVFVILLLLCDPLLCDPRYRLCVRLCDPRYVIPVIGYYVIPVMCSFM